MPHKPSKRAGSNLHYNPNQLPLEHHHHPPYPPYMNGSAVHNSGLVHSNHPSHSSPVGYQMAHQHYYENPNSQYSRGLSQPSTSSVPNQGTSTSTTKTSHQPDEEAAATALLMSAGGPHRNEFQVNEMIKDQSRKCNDSTDGKSIAEVFHVSPSSNEGLHDDNGGVGDHDSIQGELRGTEDIATIDDFSTRLHELLTCGDFSSVAHWMPSGKSWRVVNWHEFSNAMPKYFPKFCENDRGENASVMNRMNSFLNEVQVWGFEKERDDAGVVCYYHEFFIKIAPNLCKYMKPDHHRSTKSSRTAKDQILSPPRIGRFPQQNATSNMESIFCGKRSERDNLTNANEGVVLKSRGDNASTTTSSTGIFTQSPITPSFILTNQVSPTSLPPRGRLQSNRGRSRRGDGVVTVSQQTSYPISKRGRGRRVSSRGGRVGNDGLGIPRKLDIPIRYSDQSASPLVESLPPRAN